MAAYQSELAVIIKAKDLCSYVMTVTDKSPKRFRFTLVAKLQNYALDIIWTSSKTCTGQTRCLSKRATGKKRSSA